MAPAAHRDGAAEAVGQRVFHFGKGRSDGNKTMKDLVRAYMYYFIHHVLVICI